MRTLFLFLTFSLIGFTTISQTKTAHINYSELVLEMPETQAADQELDELTKTYQEQLKQLDQQYKEKLKAFEAEQEKLKGAIREMRLKELKDLEETYKSFLEAAKKEISAKDKALFVPIFEKAKEAVKEVAQSKGYSYVIDSSKENYIYLDPKHDLMDLVKEKLGNN